ncbi:hypothetical protein ABZV67_45010 [Streptomyces sp. NPDC005065]|uniref:hypothetical protein n=1 Tax=Streptomyces sp. NPDC005065 TaxID=3154461 RepID=UPI0033A9C616
MKELSKAEEARLRLALTVIEHEVGGGAPVEGPDARTIHRRRGVIARALIAAVAVGGVAIGLGALLTGGDEPGARPGAGGDGKLSTEGMIACAQAIVEGQVVAVRDAPQPDRVILTFAVQDWIKPAAGAQETEFNVLDPAVDGVYRRWRSGEHVLLLIESNREAHVNTFRGDAIAGYRARVERALPKAAGMKCDDRGDT